MHASGTFTAEQITELKGLYGAEVPFIQLQENVSKGMSVLSNELKKAISALLGEGIEDIATVTYETLSKHFKIHIAIALGLTDFEKARFDHVCGNRHNALAGYIKTMQLSENEKERVKALFHFCSVFLEEHAAEGKKTWYKQLIEKKYSDNVDFLQVNVIQHIGLLFSAHFNEEESLEKYHILNQIALGKSHEIQLLQALANSQIGTFFEQQGDLEQALKHYHDVLKMPGYEIKDLCLQKSNVLYKIARILANNGQHEESKNILFRGSIVKKFFSFIPEKKYQEDIAQWEKDLIERDDGSDAIQMMKAKAVFSLGAILQECNDVLGATEKFEFFLRMMLTGGYQKGVELTTEYHHVLKFLVDQMSNSDK